MAKKKSTKLKRIRWDGTLKQATKAFGKGFKVVTKRDKPRLVIPGVEYYAREGDTVIELSNGKFRLNSQS